MSDYCNNCNGTGYVRDGYDGEKPCPWCGEPEETTLRDEEAERNPQPVSAQLEPVSPEGDATYWRARAEILADEVKGLRSELNFALADLQLSDIERVNLREALKFYADEHNYYDGEDHQSYSTVDDDHGKLARRFLGKKGGE